MNDRVAGGHLTAPSPALALAAAAGEDISTRDRFIARAAAHGDTVGAIAEYLGLSRQQVHSIVDRQRQVAGADPGEPRPSAEQMSAWRATEIALEAMTSGETFERLVHVLLGDIDSTIRPMGGVGDRARDAVADLAGGDSSLYSISLEREWTRKIRREVMRIVDFGYRPPFVYAISNRRTTRAAEQKLEDWAQSHGITLRVLGQRWLVSKLLHPSYLELRSQMLHLAAPKPKVFLDPQSYRELLNGRPANQGLNIPWVGGTAFRVSIRKRLDERPTVVLQGPGGAGKTRVALDLADNAANTEHWLFLDDLTPIRDDALAELGAGHELVVVIDNAHRRRDIAEVLALLERRRPQPRVVFVVRPNRVETLEQALRSVWIGPLRDDDYVRVRGLANPEVAALVKGPPFNLTYDGMIRAIVLLAEGNPLVAILAARLAHDGQSIAELSRAEVFAEHVSGLLGSLVDRSDEPRQLREVLAIVAALGAMNRGDETTVGIAAQLLGFGPRAVRRWLEQLADLGLLVEDQLGLVAIKPDLLAEHVLVASFFSRRWPAQLPYEDVLAAFGPISLESMCAALGRVPPGQLDAQHPGPQALRNRILPILQAGEIELAAQLMRLLLPGTEDVILDDLERLVVRVEQLPRALTRQVGETLVEATQRISVNIARGWELLLRVAAAASDPNVLTKAREAMQSIYQRVPTDSSQHDGSILGMVQDVIAQATRSYVRHAATPGQFHAAAMAGQALLTTTVEFSRMSVEDSRQIQLGALVLPASPATKTALDVGVDVIVSTFPHIDDAERLRAIAAATELARRAGGFPGPFGLHVSRDAQRMTDQVLEKFDAYLEEKLQELAMPVQAEALGYLLARQEWLRPTDDDPAPLATVRSLPFRSDELDEYVLLVHPKDIEPPSDRLSWEEEQQARQAKAARIAQQLTIDPRWRERLARWERWGEEAARLTEQGQDPYWQVVVLTEVAHLDAGRAVEIIDTLFADGSELRLRLGGAIHQLVADNAIAPPTLTRWLQNDEQVRAMIATSIADVDSDLARRTFQKLSDDRSEIVRRGVLNGLRHGTSTTERKIELGLTISRDLADINALRSILLLAEVREIPITEHLAGLAGEALLASASIERLDDRDLVAVIQQLAATAPALALEWAWRRIDWLGQTSRAWMLHPLPQALASSIRQQASADDLANALRQFARLDPGNPAATGVLELMNWIDPAAPEITDHIVQHYHDPDHEQHARDLLGLTLSWDQCRIRAEQLANALDDDEITLHLVHNMLPKHWSGSRVPDLRTALQHVTEWDQTSPSPAFRSALATVATNLNRCIEAETQRDRRDDELALWGHRQ
jgi:hypothetical protein